MRPYAVAMTCAVLLTGTPFVAISQVQDHLNCYKVKDQAPKATYSADLSGLAPEPGCVIRVPAKLLCVQTTKSSVSPTPPGGGPVPAAAGRFLCYKLKCPKPSRAPLAVSDQFGSRSVVPSTAKLLCAP